MSNILAVVQGEIYGPFEHEDDARGFIARNGGVGEIKSLNRRGIKDAFPLFSGGDYRVLATTWVSVGMYSMLLHNDNGALAIEVHIDGKEFEDRPIVEMCLPAR